MNLEEIKLKSKLIFDSWIELVATEEELQNKDRLFEFFYSGYLAGTKYSSQEKAQRPNSNIYLDDINRNLDL